MKPHKNFSQGYIALVILLLGVVLIATLMFMQYQKSGLSRLETGPAGSDENSSADVNMNTNANGHTPIEAAQEAKNILQSRNRATINP